MKLLEQIMEELGADNSKSFTVIPRFGGYFQSVKSISEYTTQRIVLKLKKCGLTLIGEDMQVEKYFEEDLFIKGDIKGIQID